MNSNPYSAPKTNDELTWEPLASLPRDVHLQGSLSVQDVLHTQLIILRHRWIYAVLTLAIYVAFVIVLGTFAPGETLFANTFMVLGLIVMPAIMPLTLLMIFLRLHRDAKQKSGIFAATETRLSNDGIHTTMKSNEMTIPWTAFSRFLCSDRVLLLFLKKSNNHLIVARSKLRTEEDWAILRGFIAYHFKIGPINNETSHLVE